MTSTLGRGCGTALCTVLNDDYAAGFLVLCHSLLRENPGLDVPFIVVHHPDYAPLSPDTKALASRAYPNIEFHLADADAYQTVWANRDKHLHTPNRLRSAFFILEAFSLSRFKRVIALDSDMICLGRLNALLESDAPLAACTAFRHPGAHKLDYFNSGTLVIGTPHLTGETYRRLLTHHISPNYETRKGKADQAILNDFFQPGSITELPEAFNASKRKYPDSRQVDIDSLRADDVRLLHFVGEKPWQDHRSPDERVYCVLETLWWDLCRTVITFDELSLLYRIQQRRIIDEFALRDSERVSADLLESIESTLRQPISSSLWDRLFPARARIKATRSLIREALRGVKRNQRRLGVTTDPPPPAST